MTGYFHHFGFIVSGYFIMLYITLMVQQHWAEIVFQVGEVVVSDLIF